MNAWSENFGDVDACPSGACAAAPVKARASATPACCLPPAVVVKNWRCKAAHRTTKKFRNSLTDQLLLAVRKHADVSGTNQRFLYFQEMRRLGLAFVRTFCSETMEVNAFVESHARLRLSALSADLRAEKQMTRHCSKCSTGSRSFKTAFRIAHL